MYELCIRWSLDEALTETESLGQGLECRASEGGGSINLVEEFFHMNYGMLCWGGDGSQRNQTGKKQ